MAFYLKQLLAFCVLAGIASAAIHGNAHTHRERCTQSHGQHNHEGHDHHSLPDDCNDHDCTPHHHCCHLPVADRPSLDRQVLASFQESLMAISAEHSLIPDEPVFSLDKPPLI